MFSQRTLQGACMSPSYHDGNAAGQIEPSASKTGSYVPQVEKPFLQVSFAVLRRNDTTDQARNNLEGMPRSSHL